MDGMAGEVMMPLTDKKAMKQAAMDWMAGEVTMPPIGKQPHLIHTFQVEAPQEDRQQPAAQSDNEEEGEDGAWTYDTMRSGDEDADDEESTATIVTPSAK